MSWQVINNLLRVIRNGLEVKQAVDSAIDQAGEGINLRDCIEEARGASRIFRLFTHDARVLLITLAPVLP